MRVYSLSLLLAFLTIPASADIVPIPGSQRVRPVFDSADLVCAGTVSSVIVSTAPMPVNSPTGWIKQYSKAVIEIKDTYKENDAERRTVTVVVEANVPASSAQYSVFRGGDTFLFFLKSSSAGDYALADPFLGATHFAFVPRRSRDSGLGKLEDALTQIAIHGQEEDALRALQVLSGFDTISADNLGQIKQLASSSNPFLAVSAFDVLLIAKNAQSLQDLSVYLRGYKGAAEPIALSNIANKLADFRDKESLPWIEDLTQSRYVSVRTGALRSLRTRKDSTTVGVLIGRLDDSDTTIQYLAVIALAETLNKYDGEYAPSMYLFDKKPTFYITLWKQWWADEGRNLYPSPRVAEP